MLDGMTDTRKITALLIGAVLLLGLAGCGPGSGAGGGAPKKAPAAGGPQHGDPGGAQPAPVQADPSAHNTQAGEVDLHVDWTAENSSTPACEWTKNGRSSPCAAMERGEKVSGTYYGLWEWNETGKAGDVFTVNAQGNIGVKSITCMVWWKGVYHEGVTNGRRCGINFTLN